MTILWDLTLDGNSIGLYVDKLTLGFNESSVHNTITISSIDRTLFFNSDPDVLSGTGRIILYIGNRTIYFLLEDRRGGETNFSLWGRSISAMDEVPYRDNVDYVLTAPKLASQVVGDLITENSVQWDLIDWMIPKEFSHFGNPIEGALKVVKTVGGILRCRDDGTIYARNKWKVRPVNISSTASAVDYDRISNLITLNANNVKGTGETSVIVTGYISNMGNPIIEVVEENPVQSQDVHVRIFWGNLIIPNIIGSYVSDGYLANYGSYYDQYEDDVTFIEGVANLPRPIHALTSVDWYGLSAAPVSFTTAETELFSTNLWGIAKIKYWSAYNTYRLYGHDEEKLLMALTMDSLGGVEVKVRLNVSGDNEANPISDGNLTTQEAAKIRGVYYLDNNYYNKKQVVVEAPFYEQLQDGIVVNIADVPADVTGRFYVQGYTMNFDGPKITNQISVVQPS